MESKETFGDGGGRKYANSQSANQNRQSLLRQLFLAADSLKLFLSPQRAHVTFFVKCDKLELAFWLLCSMHAVIQVLPDGVVGSRNCCCHPFAAGTINVAVYLNRETVSALTSGLLHLPAQPTT